MGSRYHSLGARTTTDSLMQAEVGPCLSSDPISVASSIARSVDSAFVLYEGSVAQLQGIDSERFKTSTSCSLS